MWRRQIWGKLWNNSVCAIKKARGVGNLPALRKSADWWFSEQASRSTNRWPPEKHMLKVTTNENVVRIWWMRGCITFYKLLHLVTSSFLGIEFLLPEEQSIKCTKIGAVWKNPRWSSQWQTSGKISALGRKWVFFAFACVNIYFREKLIKHWSHCKKFFQSLPIKKT